MRRIFYAFLILALSGFVVGRPYSHAQSPSAVTLGPPLRVEVTRGNFRPIQVTINQLTGEHGQQITSIIRANLENSGLFTVDVRKGNISLKGSEPDYAAFRKEGASALASGSILRRASGKISAQFSLWDLVEEKTLFTGKKFAADTGSWRRIAHKISDAIYSALTGEKGYYDSTLLFIEETGPKNNRKKRLAIMDQDGANMRYLTDGSDLVLTPRFSPDASKISYISFRDGEPQIHIIDVASGKISKLGKFPDMTLSPRFSPSGNEMLISMVRDGAVNVHLFNLRNRRLRRITRSSGIDVGADFSPDGERIVFESDRGGAQQLYVMNRDGTNVERISFGNGRYGTPSWSPRGDLIAFTMLNREGFHIGVVKPDGSDERILTRSFLDESPSWAPNGQFVTFFRETAGSFGASSIYSIDIWGRKLRKLPTPAGASDPSWSPLRK